MSEFEIEIVKELTYVFHIEAESKEEDKNEALLRIKNDIGYECIETRMLKSKIKITDITEFRENTEKENNKNDDEDILDF